MREELVRRTRSLWEKELLEANEVAEEDGDPFKTVAEIKARTSSMRLPCTSPRVPRRLSIRCCGLWA